MQNIFNKLNEAGCRNIDMVLHLGAALCSELEDYLQIGASKIVLVEANAMLADRLKAKTSHIAGVSVINTAISGHDGDARLNVTNNPNETSLLIPTTLFNYYPNLRVASEQQIQTRSLNNLLIELDLLDENANLLVLELQGLEHEVLVATTPTLIQKFDCIAIRTSEEELYEGGAARIQLEEQLKEYGFDLIEFDNKTQSPLFLERYYRRNSEKIEIQELKQQLEILQQTSITSSKKLIDYKNQITKLKVEIKKLINEQDKLAQERQAQIEQLTQLKDEQDKLAQERQAQIDQLNQDRDEALEEVNISKNRIQDLERQLSESVHRQDLLDNEFIKAEAQIELIKDILIREKAF